MHYLVFVVLLLQCISNMLISSGQEIIMQEAPSEFTNWLGEKRYLRRKNKNIDIAVVSMGGTGCTNMIAKIGKAWGKKKKPVTNNIFNEDRMKHSYPEGFLNSRISLGVIYVTGNLTLAIKSLVRRHFVYVQVGVLKGDKNWVQSEQYSLSTWSEQSLSSTKRTMHELKAGLENSSNESISLFRKAPKWERAEDLAAGSVKVKSYC